MLGVRPAGLLESVFVHPLALVESPNIGAGTRVWGFAHVLKGANIGENCNLGEGVYVEGSARVGDRVTLKNGISVWDLVEIGDDAFIGPHVVFTNDMRTRAFIKRGKEALVGTKIEEGATIGAGSVIVCGTTIGSFAFVAAGSVVTKDIPSHGYVRGNPARLVGYVCRCAATFFGLDAKATKCGECGESNPKPG